MNADISQQRVSRAATGGIAHSDRVDLRAFATAAGLSWAVLFVIIGLGYELQTYGDGATFSYAVAAEDSWAFHWHNIAGRFVVYLESSVPGEIYVALTGDARGGIAVYGFLFFAAPLMGLLATFAADRSKGRAVSAFACGSTACLAPLVVGFPTEMWIAHALFWPTLALGHYARRDAAGSALVFAALLALAFTHEGALVLALVIVATLLLRGRHDAAFLRAARALAVVVPIWAAVHALFPPDYYYAAVFYRAALHFFDVTILTQGIMGVLAGALAGYGIAVLALRRISPNYAPVCAAALVAAALAFYWLRFGHPPVAEDRYYMRTVLLIGTAMSGIVAAAYAVWTEGDLSERTILSRAMTALAGGVWAQALVGALALVVLIHAVETARFVEAFGQYRAAVRALAMGAESDGALGDPQFVSAARLHRDLDPLAWPSTTHFLSVLVAPDFAPRHLVVDPRANYFWISCRTATRNQETNRALPAHARLLVRLHACLHR
jgi:hypothetical protein